MRDAFSTTLVDLAKNDERVLLLTGDHGYALFDEFRKQCPSQYINAGIAEQNMVGMAAGLARLGFRPFVYGLSAFVPVRVLEQIKLDVAHDDLPVVFLGDGAGFVYSHLGTSHQSTEDIACTRTIPNMVVMSPCDRFEMAACMRLAYESSKPVYLRMGKSDRGDVHTAPVTSLAVGDLVKVKSGANSGITLVATGSMVKTALEVAADHDLSVWSVPSIKPIDEDTVVRIAKDAKGVVVLEEHSVYGGLGSCIAEITSERSPVKVLKVGVADRFSEHCGTYDYLLEEHGIDAVTVKQKVSAFIHDLDAR